MSGRVYSLNAQHSILADAREQIEIIEQHGQTGNLALVPFREKLQQSNLYPLKPTQIEIIPDKHRQDV